MEYLGNKSATLNQVCHAIGRDLPGARVLDAFSGTGVVSTELRRRGFKVHANDNLELCANWARGSLLLGVHDAYKRVDDLVGLRCSRARYVRLLEVINASSPRMGFVALNFSPLSLDTAGVERKYFTVENAMKIDAIRHAIDQLSEQLDEGERAFLLSTLIAATIQVSNTAGTFGCYLKSWKPKALQPLVLKELRFPEGPTKGHRVTRGDAVAAAEEAQVDVIYADPPYTKRQYAAYYHVLETIIRNDEPMLSGSTGLRDWNPESSAWCYKTRAEDALEAIVAKSSASRFVLSYNEDGQISHPSIIGILSRFGSVTVFEDERRRYRSSRRPHKGATVTERTYVLERA